MTKSNSSKQDLIGLRDKILAQINKQHEPTPKEKYDQAIYNRTMNPETMPAERLREFQAHGWFLRYEPRELTPEQAAIEEEEFQSIVNEVFPSKKETSIDQSKIRTDHEYQKMIRRVLDEVFPD